MVINCFVGSEPEMMRANFAGVLTRISIWQPCNRLFLFATRIFLYHHAGDKFVLFTRKMNETGILFY